MRKVTGGVEQINAQITGLAILLGIRIDSRLCQQIHVCLQNLLIRIDMLVWTPDTHPTR